MLVWLTFFLACRGEGQSGRNDHPENDVFRILALGDSYTIGERVNPDEQWPIQLVKALRQRKFDVEDPVIVARTGWTTDELAEGIGAENLEGPFDIVTLLIGVNNQYRGRSVEQYRQEFRSLLKTAVRFAGGESNRVIVLSIPDWGVTPFAEDRNVESISREIDRFNAVNLDETMQLRARYVNITPISRQAADNVSLLADDGLHPSGRMYKEWVDHVLPIAGDILRTESISKSVRDTP